MNPEICLESDQILLLLELVHDAVFILDHRQQIIAVNGAAARWLGQEQDAIAGQCFVDFLALPSREEWALQWDGALRGNKTRQRRSLKHKAGHSFPVDMTLQALSGDRIAVVTSLVADRPVEPATRRKRVGQSHIAADRMTHFVWTASLDGTLASCNQFWRDYTGLPEETCLKCGLAAALHPDDAARVLPALADAFQKGSRFEAKGRMRRSDGEYRWFAVRCEPVRTSQGRLAQWIGTGTDIDDQVRLEDALRKSEELFHDLARLSPVGIFRTDPRGRCIYVNEHWRTMTGLTWEQARGDGWMEALHPEDRGAMLAAWEQAVRKAESFQLEGRLLRPTGETVWCICQAAALKADQGESIGYIGILTDITQRKEAEASLRENEERFRTIFEFAPLAVSIVDGHGHCLQANQRMERLLAFGAGELHLRQFTDLAHAEDHATFSAPFLELCQGHRSWFQMEMRFVRKDREVVWGNVTASGIRNGLDQFLYAIILIEDVTERKTMEEELRRSTQSFQTLAALAPVGIFRTDAHNRCTYVNERWCEMTGLRPEQALGDGWMRGLPAEQRAHETTGWRNAVASGLPYQWEGALECPNKETRWVICQALPEHGPQGETRGYIGSLTDITERKWAEEQHLLLERRLQEAQKLESLGILAGGIAHDFNNLLTGILGHAALAQSGLSGDAENQRYLQQIEKAALRAADLCKQMLAYSGKGRFVIEPIDLNALLQDATSALKLALPARIALRLDLAEEIPLVQADVAQIRQVIMNLAVNASEAIGERHGLITMATGVVHANAGYFAQTVFAPELPEGDYAVLEVSDNGCGISADLVKKVFDPFFSTKFVGRGLGLAAVLGIVRSHKGAIHVYSEKGRGSTFKILLPSLAPTALKPPADAPDGKLWKGTGTLLIVDDEEFVRSVAAQMVQKLGFRTLTVSSGEEAVQTLREHADEVSLVLLDLTMPGMDGVRVFSELRKIQPGLRVLLMSGFNEQEAVSRFAGRGLAGFLQKPFRLETLRERLKTILG